jgi:hypothetical protein
MKLIGDLAADSYRALETLLTPEEVKDDQTAA